MSFSQSVCSDSSALWWNCESHEKVQFLFLHSSAIEEKTGQHVDGQQINQLKKKKEKKLSPAEVFQGHWPSTTTFNCVVYLLATLLMWLHSLNSIAALLMQQSLEADSTYPSLPTYLHKENRSGTVRNVTPQIYTIIFNAMLCYSMLYNFICGDFLLEIVCKWNQVLFMCLINSVLMKTLPVWKVACIFNHNHARLKGFEWTSSSCST